jgi:hypothetical protein
VPATGVARLARTTSDGSTQRVMSRGADKQKGRYLVGERQHIKR